MIQRMFLCILKNSQIRTVVINALVLINPPSRIKCIKRCHSIKAFFVAEQPKISWNGMLEVQSEQNSDDTKRNHDHCIKETVLHQNYFFFLDLIVIIYYACCQNKEGSQTIFCSNASQKKLEKVNERALRLALSDYTSSYRNLLVNAESTKIHIHSIRLLALEIYKTLHNLNPAFMKDCFLPKSSSYNLSL